MKVLSLPALNIQAPWADLIVSGKKTIETRNYRLPEFYVGKPIFILETPGRNRMAKRRIVGTVVFSGSFEYKSRRAFYLDYSRHLVDESSPFAWDLDSKRIKWGWTILRTEQLTGTIARNQRTGIIFTKLLKVHLLE